MVNVTLVDIPAPTDGAASTIQYAQPFVGNGPVFVVNSDQTFGLGRTAENQFALFRGYADSVVLCFESDGNSKWSYFDPTTQNIVEKPLEPPKGNYATVGAYWVWHKEMLFEAIHEMKFQDYRVNGEFYFAPALNFLQRQPEPLLVDHFFGLGTPEDLLKYEDWLVGW